MAAGATTAAYTGFDVAIEVFKVCVSACARERPAPLRICACLCGRDVRARICATSTDTLGRAGTRVCGRVLQLVPYVKTMFSAVWTLRRACSHAVHNKERCTALGE